RRDTVDDARDLRQQSALPHLHLHRLPKRACACPRRWRAGVLGARAAGRSRLKFLRRQINQDYVDADADHPVPRDFDIRPAAEAKQAAFAREDDREDLAGLDVEIEVVHVSEAAAIADVDHVQKTQVRRLYQHRSTSLPVVSVYTLQKRKSSGGLPELWKSRPGVSLAGTQSGLILLIASREASTSSLTRPAAADWLRLSHKRTLHSTSTGWVEWAAPSRSCLTPSG